MSDIAEVQVVRCPKCEKLLPELHDSSLYRCRGCGTFLRAKEKIKSSLSEGLSEKSWDETGGECPLRSVKLESVAGYEREYDGVKCGRPKERSFEVSRTRSRKGDPTESFLTDYDLAMKSPARSIAGSFRKSPIRESVSADGVSKSQAKFTVGDAFESKSVVSVELDNVMKERVGAWVDEIGMQEETAQRSINRKASFDECLLADANMCRSTLDRPNRSSKRIWMESAEVALEDLGSNLEKLQVGVEEKFMYPDDHGRMGFNQELEREGIDLRFQSGYAGRSGRSRLPLEQWGIEGDGLRAIRGSPKVVGENRSISSSFYGHDLLRNDMQNSRESAQNLEQNRAELLRRYIEIKGQLSRAGDTCDNRSSSPICYTEHDNFIEDELLRERGSMQLLSGNKNIWRPPYVNHSRETIPFSGGHNMVDWNDVYRPSRFVPNEIPIYDDQYLVQMPRSAPHHQRYHPQQSAHDYLPMRFKNLDQDHRELDPLDKYFHHQTHSCTHFCINNCQAHLPVASTAFGNRRSPNNSYGPWVTNPRIIYPAAQDPSYVTASSDQDSETGRFAHRRPRRRLISNLNKGLCHPIAGGAPFVLCSSCFQLLKLPRKLLTMGKNQCRLQCGACFAMVTFHLENKRYVVPVPVQSRPNAADANNCSDEMLNEAGHEDSHDSAAGSSIKVESYDFDANVYSFQSVDSEPNVLVEEQRQHSSEAEKRQSHHPSSSCSLKVENKDLVVVQIDVANSVEMTLKNNLSRPPPGSPLQEHLDYSNAFSLSRVEVENNTNCEEQENGIPEIGALHLNFEETAAIASEMEISFNEFPTTGLHWDSAVVSREDQVEKKKGTKTSFAAFIRGFRGSNESTRDGSNEETGVYVNGYLIPRHGIRSAEKLAGPISPGDYWYDSKAGFWGDMGNCCLGIIPPFIQEFSFPMPVNCAGGNTAIYVNGRELHTRDLDLLASRGFPTMRGKFYIVEISGKVVDEDTGQLVVNLGKLAPTVPNFAAKCMIPTNCPRYHDVKVRDRHTADSQSSVLYCINTLLTCTQNTTLSSSAVIIPTKSIDIQGVEKAKRGFGMKVPEIPDD